MLSGFETRNNYQGSLRYKKNAIHYWEPARCFCTANLYSMRFGTSVTDVLERQLFGIVGKKGVAAADCFRYYDDPIEGMREAYLSLISYIGAQRFRTPRGLEWLSKRTGLHGSTDILFAMSSLFQAHGTMWMEAVWEIVHARQSGLKFILSDNPVTFFNRSLVPGGLPSTGGNDFPKVGTRTIFPLGMDSCLIITHLQLVRNPWNEPLERRENARSFQPTMTKFTDIQFGRELTENEVLRINLILKRSAAKFIAAPSREALYPEQYLPGISWVDIDRDWFLFPNPWKVGFTTQIMVGYPRPRQAALPCYHNQQPTRPSNRTQPAESQLRHGRAQPGVDWRHHLHPDRRGMAVSGRGHRPVQSPGGGLVDAAGDA